MPADHQLDQDLDRQPDRQLDRHLDRRPDRQLDRPPRPSLSTTQLASSALAAVTAAVVGSRLGIAGTVLGAAAGSVIGSAGTVLYSYWLDRTATRVRTVVRLPATRRDGTGFEVDGSEPTDRTAVAATILAAGSAERGASDERWATHDSTGVLTAVTEHPDRSDDLTTGDASNRSEPTTAVLAPAAVNSRWRRPRWQTVAISGAGAFAVAIGSITVFEAITGEPVSTLTGGGSGSGTTLGRVVEGPSSADAPADLPTTPATTDPTTPPTSPSPTPTGTTPPTSPPPTTPPTTDPTTPPTETNPTTPPTTPPPTTPPSG